MQISEQIDNLISNLQKLKPNLTSDKSENKNSFNDILERSLKLNSLDVPSDNSRNGSSNNWQDSDYNFDINKPRRPNLRELMEALSGRTVEELYKEPEEKWKDISKLASDILYGVSGNKKDSRDWYKIMSANDIITEAQSETKKMHNPSVDIVSEKSTSGTVLAEYAVIKDGEGEILRTLAGSTAEIQVTLENFGATGNAIPEEIEKKITSDKFDRKVLTLLQTLSKQSLENIALETTAKAMSARYSNNIPLAEIEKL